MTILNLLLIFVIEIGNVRELLSIRADSVDDANLHECIACSPIRRRLAEIALAKHIG